jgi:hypothetical protein
VNKDKCCEEICEEETYEKMKPPYPMGKTPKVVIL